MRSLISHLRYTIRQLLKSLGFTATAVVILGLGIGANTAIFSLVNGVLLKPLPYPNADRLFHLYHTVKADNTNSFDYPDFADFCAAQHSFNGLAAYTLDWFHLSSRGPAEQIPGLYVTGSFFRVMGRPLILGRPLDEADDRPGSAAVVVLSEHLWRTHFNSDSDIIGTSVVLNSRSFEVVGVTPGQADEGSNVELYIATNQDPDFAPNKKIRRGAFYYDCVGRLRDGVTLQQATADLEVIQENLVAQYPATDAGFGVRVAPYLEGVVSDYSTTVWLLEGAVACLLLVTCANVGNLLLARAQERLREVSIRAALGASRSRLVAQLLTESVVVSVGGAILGIGIAVWSLQAIKSADASDIPRVQEVTVDNASLAFVFLVMLATALASGLLPAWTGSRVNLAYALNREGERAGTSSHRQPSQAILVAVQVALSCLLLTRAGLLMRSLEAIQRVSLGFSPDHILTAEVYLADAKYPTQAACNTFFDNLLAKVRQLPEVISAAIVNDLPFSGGFGMNAFGLVGQPDPQLKDMPILRSQIVSLDYFQTLGIPLLHGRLFDDQDGPDQQKVVVVSDEFATHFFPEQDPIGKQIHDVNSIGLKPNVYSIIGIVSAIQHDRPDFPRAPHQVYFLYSQSPFAPRITDDFTLVLHTRGDPLALVNALRQTVAGIDPNLPLTSIYPFEQVIYDSFASRRLQMTLVGVFSAAALVLAVVGLYGVLSYSVSLRKRELSVRIALGAQVPNILGLVVGQGLKIVAIGLVVGLLSALLLNQLIEGALFGVSTADPISFGASVLVLVVAALVACLLPALRATRIDPITALRE
ncbi:MAG TPA: ABC transporter permease [Chthoniobacterales bacterium]